MNSHLAYKSIHFFTTIRIHNTFGVHYSLVLWKRLIEDQDLSPLHFVYNFTDITQRTNTSNLVWFKMNHLSFLMWKLFIWDHIFTNHIRLLNSFLKTFLISQFIIDFSFSLREILGTIVILGLENQFKKNWIITSIMLCSVILCHAMNKGLSFPAMNVEFVSNLLIYIVAVESMGVVYLAPPPLWAELFQEGCQLTRDVVSHWCFCIWSCYYYT